MSDLVSAHASPDGKIVQWWFYCPGCKGSHAFTVYKDDPARGWQFNGDPASPTFTPSLGVFMGDAERRCHLFVTDGKIRFLSDCYHDLAGRTVDMRPEED